MGDSMAQGFNNGGIYRTELSFPAILARSLGKSTKFDAPSFTAQAGIPINMEVLIRGLEEELGSEITLWNSVQAGRYVYQTLRRIKSYWEGQMKDLRVERNLPFHNQAVWGFSISDCWLINEKFCSEYLNENRARYSVFSVLPDNAMYTTGRMVLNPGYKETLSGNTMLDNIEAIHNDGGLENLIVCIGHNNIVGSVTKLKIEYSTESDLNAPYPERSCTVFRPEHFRTELRTLYEKVAKVGVGRVFVPTIPYVTIPPAIRGVNLDGSCPGDGYFDYYARFWIWDEDFSPEKHPHLTRGEAVILDQTVDRYNSIIKELADEFDFTVVPVHHHVHAAARRRHLSDGTAPFPPSFIEALKRNPKTSFMVDKDGEPRISTDYLRLDDETGKIDRGGIFSLDGLHPTTIGYGLIANIYRMSMEKHGVKFERPIDWDFIIENDTLVNDPPLLLHDLRLLLRFLALGNQERFMLFGKNILQQAVEVFSSRPEVPD